MATRGEFLDLVCEQFSALGKVRARAMFGGHGLYVEDFFCAIVMDDALYFKVDAQSLPQFKAAGCAPFKPFADRPSLLQYYEAPAEVFEDRAVFLRWARLALEAALRSKSRRR